MSLTLGPIFNSQKDKVREWSIVVSLFSSKHKPVPINSIDTTEIKDGYYASYITISGYTGMKMTTSAATIVSVGKNIGRKNETSVLTQAYKECQSKYASKIKAGYTENVTTTETSNTSIPFPMAVKSWKDHKSKISYPCFVQPKLDGVRMLAKYDGNEVMLITRRLHNIVGFEKVKEELRLLFHQSKLKSMFIDGELYSHGTTLQTISGIVRNESIEEEVKATLQYHVFDCFDVHQPEMGFGDRIELLKTFVQNAKSNVIVLNDTVVAEHAGDADTYYTKVISEGYEGIIYKSMNRPYEFDFNKEKRSSWYLKRKKQDDAEYPIVGFSQGKGKDLGCIVFELQTDKKKFNCVPNGTYEYRKQLYAEALSSFDTTFKGKLAKVVFDDLSKDQVPLRGRIVQIGRDISFD